MRILKRIFSRRQPAEQRSASLSLKDPALAWLFGLGADTAPGIAVTPETARQCPEVDAAVGLIEDTLATLPLDLFERRGDDERERLSDHPLHILLHDRPNAWQTSSDFRKMMEGWRITEGNAYAEIKLRGDGMAGALEPMPPNEVQPYRLASGRIAYRHQPANGRERILLQEEVLHLRDHPRRRNLIEGESRVQRHKETIARALATGEYLGRFFSNNAVPKSYLELPAGVALNKEQMELLRDQMESRHAGLQNAHRMGVLNAGLKIHRAAATNDEAQLIEAYQLIVTQIARIWSVPLHMINELSKSTSWGSGIEEQSIGFVVYKMRPKLKMWEEAINSALLTVEQRRKYYFEFNIDGLLRGDFKARMEGYALQIQWGLATPNELRRQSNLPPLPGGDERMHPLNMVPASRVMDVLLRDSGRNQQQSRDALDQATRLLIGIVDAARREIAKGENP